MTIDLPIIHWHNCDAAERSRLLARPVFNDGDRPAVVAAIVHRVRRDGDRALAELTAEFDGCTPSALEVDAAELEAALEATGPALREAMADAADRIRAFHAADRPQAARVETAPGLVCEVRYPPLSPVGLYIPGGSAPLVSTVMMLAIPAALAGCEEIVLVSPPGPDGRIAPEILAAARFCGVTRVFCVGGAQAIAALAYGTETVPRCAKIFGPGNAWVTEAKQQVAQDPAGAAIDMPAGPSEVLVIADNTLCPVIPFANLALSIPSKSIPLIGYPTTISCLANYLVLKIVNQQHPHLKDHQERLEQVYLENDILFNMHI